MRSGNGDDFFATIPVEVGQSADTAVAVRFTAMIAVDFADVLPNDFALGIQQHQVDFIVVPGRQADGRVGVVAFNNIQGDRYFELFVPGNGTVGIEGVELFSGSSNNFFPAVEIQIIGD